MIVNIFVTILIMFGVVNILFLIKIAVNLEQWRDRDERWREQVLDAAVLTIEKIKKEKQND